MDTEHTPAPWSLPVLQHPALIGGRGCYLTGEDHLRITTFNAAAGVTLAVEGRMLTPNGEVKPFAGRHVPNTDRSSASTTVILGEGWLLDVVVRASAGTPRIGQCYALLELVRGSTGAVSPVAFLSSGYVTDTSRFSWPSSSARASCDGPGVIRSITGTDPAANAEISETVPTNARWRVLSLHAVLVTDANVANRIPMLVIDDGVNDLLRSSFTSNQAASLTYRHTWSEFAVFQHNNANAINESLPFGLMLMGGYRLRTSTAALQATDNWGPPQMLVEEWIED